MPQPAGLRNHAVIDEQLSAKAARDFVGAFILARLELTRVNFRRTLEPRMETNQIAIQILVINPRFQEPQPPSLFTGKMATGQRARASQWI